MRMRTWLLLTGVVVGVAGLFALAYFWRHPSAFDENARWAAGNELAEVGEPLYVGMTYEDEGASGSITIHAVTPHVVADTGGAAVDFLVCTVDPEVVGAVGVVGDDEITRECSSLTPAEGATMRLNASPHQQVVMAVTLGKAGRVVIDGIDIDYGHGWQRGHQSTGGEIVISTSPS